MSYLGIAINLWPMIVPGHFISGAQTDDRFLAAMAGLVPAIHVLLPRKRDESSDWPIGITPRQTVFSPSTRALLPVGTLLPLPVIPMNTAWSYWVFRGKMRGDIGDQ